MVASYDLRSGVNLPNNLGGTKSGLSPSNKSKFLKLLPPPFARKNLLMGVAWMDGRSRAAGTGKAASCDSGGGKGVAYEARGYKQGWADGKADGPNRATHNVLCN